MEDTSPAAKARYYELLRQQLPMDRLRTAVLLTRSVRQLAEADILRANPAASPRERQRALVSRLYGDEVALRLFPAEPGAVSHQVEPDVLDVALRVARAIERCGGEYFVGESVASSLQGEPRATNDIDFVLTMPIGKIEALREELGSNFEVDVDMLRTALMTASTANAFYLPLVTKIDFFGRGNDPFDDSEFERRRAVQIRSSGETLMVKAPEDTVLRKLLWYRAGGEVSDKQWRDIQSVLRISGDQMDETYLDTWAERLDVVELLRRARAQS